MASKVSGVKVWRRMNVELDAPEVAKYVRQGGLVFVDLPDGTARNLSLTDDEHVLCEICPADSTNYAHLEGPCIVRSPFGELATIADAVSVGADKISISVKTNSGYFFCFVGRGLSHDWRFKPVGPVNHMESLIPINKADGPKLGQFP